MAKQPPIWGPDPETVFDIIARMNEIRQIIATELQKRDPTINVFGAAAVESERLGAAVNLEIDEVNDTGKRRVRTVGRDGLPRKMAFRSRVVVRAGMFGERNRAWRESLDGGPLNLRPIIDHVIASLEKRAEIQSERDRIGHLCEMSEYLADVIRDDLTWIRTTETPVPGCVRVSFAIDIEPTKAVELDRAIAAVLDPREEET